MAKRVGDFGLRLHTARWKAGLTLRELGKELGMSAATLQRVERKNLPSLIRRWFELKEWLEQQEKRDG